MWMAELLGEVEEVAASGAELWEEAEAEAAEEATSPAQQTTKGHRWQGRGKMLTRDQERITIEEISEPERWLEEDSLDDVHTGWPRFSVGGVIPYMRRSIEIHQWYDLFQFFEIESASL